MYKGISLRQRRILDILKNKTYSSVKELSDELYVSQPTMRRDLGYLSTIGVIDRVHGGVRIKMPEASFFIDTNRYYSHWEEKARIGKEAAKLVKDNDVIAINSGTTVMALINNLWELDRLTVVTQDYELAGVISQKKEFTAIVSGGKIQKGITGVAGKDGINIFESFLFDICFLGVSSLSLEDGLMMSKFSHAENARVIISRSRKVVILADSSKFQRRSGTVAAPFERADVLITDAGIRKKPDLLKSIEQIRTIDMRIV